MSRKALATACIAASFLGTACSAATGSPTYGGCNVTDECLDAADTCVWLTTAEATGSQCTHECATDDECPRGGRCVTSPEVGSICHRLCVTHGTCEPGWACTDLGDGRKACLPGARPPLEVVRAYQPCTPGSFDECGADVQGCFTLDSDAELAICTSRCSALRGCPPGGVCTAFEGHVATCYPGCLETSDCLPGLECRTSLPDGTTFPPICLPMP